MSEINLIPSKDAPEGFPYLENHVRAQLGIQKDEIRELRQDNLTEDVQWKLWHKRIWLSLEAVQRLMSLKGISQKNGAQKAAGANADDGDPLKSTITKKPAAPEPVTLMAVRATRNPHILAACMPDDNPACPKKPLRVRVKTAANFRPQMKFQAVLVAGYKDLFDLVGPHPRKTAFTPMVQTSGGGQ
jgi:hypothetical protein